ncbi:MAG TPA: AraC family transcriptional regulator [Steroidobacteraceae bacterium]|jgi:AraC family transcriptional activator of mtrCDE
MKAEPLSRISPFDLNRLMASLDVEVVALSECLVNTGFRLEIGDVERPGIHYVMKGTGRIVFKNGLSFDVAPHSLIIVAPNTSFMLEPAPAESSRDSQTTVGAGKVGVMVDSVFRIRAGDEVHEPQMIVICGYFKAQYGASTGLFEGLAVPIFEQFSAADQLDDKLQAAFDELLKQEIGAGAMSGALMKQVIVALLRRSLTSVDTWMERFAMLSDPKVARAFACMVADPGAAHTIESLAENAFLSRSAFMARFSSVIGRSPMLVLRDLRMRQAAAQLSAGAFTIDQIVRNAGYASRSSFVRMFKKVHGVEPSGYRETQETER